jgi:hypothetical protein
MPKLVSELAQGNQFGRSSDGGNLADTAVRVWKVILNSANEPLDIFAAIGVQIGDPYSSSNQVPCVSVEGRADGESRLVRIITATYKTTAGDNGAGEDPKLVMPELRPANFSTSTSLYEMPAVEWQKWSPGGNLMLANVFYPATNPVGDMYDGISRLVPVTVIRVTQFGPNPGTLDARHCGKINQETMSLGGYLTCPPHTVMFRGVEATPHVETFGTVTYRGFMNTYEFMYRPNTDGHFEIGWDLKVPVTGFNVKTFNPANPGATQDPYGQPLKYEDYKLVQPLALPDGIGAGEKVRAMVRIVNFENGKVSQLPSAQPIALNEDGTPRSEDSDPKVLTRRYQVQEEIDLTRTLALRLD